MRATVDSCRGPWVQYCRGLLATSGCKSGTWIRPAWLPTGSLARVQRSGFQSTVSMDPNGADTHRLSGGWNRKQLAPSAAAAGVTQLRQGGACFREGRCRCTARARGLTYDKRNGRGETRSATTTPRFDLSGTEFPQFWWPLPTCCPNHAHLITELKLSWAILSGSRIRTEWSKLWAGLRS